MKNEKLYFADEDATMCIPLSEDLHDAKIEGLKEIELMEAIPDYSNSELVWCTYDGEVVDRGECKKSECQTITQSQVVERVLSEDNCTRMELK